MKNYSKIVQILFLLSVVFLLFINTAKSEIVGYVKELDGNLFKYTETKTRTGTKTISTRLLIGDILNRGEKIELKDGTCTINYDNKDVLLIPEQEITLF